MRRLLLHGILWGFSCLLLLGACQKNTAPVQQTLTEQEKTELFEKLRTDALYLEWVNNQRKVHEAYRQAIAAGNIDVEKLKGAKPTSDSAYITALKQAGVQNAEEIASLNKKGMEILREIWRKYPALGRISDDQLVQLSRIR